MKDHDLCKLFSNGSAKYVNRQKIVMCIYGYIYGIQTNVERGKANAATCKQ